MVYAVWCTAYGVRCMVNYSTVGYTLLRCMVNYSTVGYTLLRCMMNYSTVGYTLLRCMMNYSTVGSTLYYHTLLRELHSTCSAREEEVGETAFGGVQYVSYSVFVCSVCLCRAYVVCV
jgi:hypothetical protein